MHLCRTCLCLLYNSSPFPFGRGELQLDLPQNFSTSSWTSRAPSASPGTSCAPAPNHFSCSPLGSVQLVDTSLYMGRPKAEHSTAEVTECCVEGNDHFLWGVGCAFDNIFRCSAGLPHHNYWLMFNYLSSRNPRVFLAELLASQSVSSLVRHMGSFHPRASHLPLLNLMRLWLTQSISWWKSELRSWFNKFLGLIQEELDEVSYPPSLNMLD